MMPMGSAGGVDDGVGAVAAAVEAFERVPGGEDGVPGLIDGEAPVEAFDAEQALGDQDGEEAADQPEGHEERELSESGEVVGWAR